MEKFIDSTLAQATSLIRENMLSSLYQWLGEDVVELLPELAISFQEQTAHLLGQMIDSLAIHNTEMLQTSASKMRCLCASMGFQQLAYLAKSLELCGKMGNWKTAVFKVEQFRIEYKKVWTILEEYTQPSPQT